MLYFVIACRGGRRWPSISDGLLLGFLVGFGFKFHEDAHIGIVTGHGWDAATPLSTFFPTTELWNDLLYNDHAVRGALEGLSIGTAAMLWHWRAAAWLVGLAGPVLMFWGHTMWNYFATHASQAAGVADSPFLFATLRDVLEGGRVPVLVLLAGAVAAAVADLLILRWVGKRDRIFPPLPVARIGSLVKQRNTAGGLSQLMAADRYLRLQRSVYVAAWRTRRAGGYPAFSDADYLELTSIAGRLGLKSAGPDSQSSPVAAAPLAGSSVAVQTPEAALPDTPAGDAPPAG